ncbi:hypothetical protein B566_EDAN015286 [Ephemera danica]|nr:hypothetical protein B566_EDAN015286 [Ephemera danica]
MITRWCSEYEIEILVHNFNSTQCCRSRMAAYSVESEIEFEPEGKPQMIKDWLSNLLFLRATCTEVSF